LAKRVDRLVLRVQGKALAKIQGQLSDEQISLLKKSVKACQSCGEEIRPSANHSFIGI